MKHHFIEILCAQWTFIFPPSPIMTSVSINCGQIASAGQNIILFLEADLFTRCSAASNL